MLYIGHCGDSGRQRELNEDSYLVLTKPTIAPEIDALFAVADGMGGHQAGDVASRMLVETLDNLFTSSVYKQNVAYNPQHNDYYVVVLKEVLEQANGQIYNLSASNPKLSGMGTTATVVLLARGYIYWGHAGDSRAYLLHKGGLQRLTNDHTWVAEQVEAGQMTLEEANRHPRRNVLTQSLGNSLLIRVERGMHPVQSGDLVLLSSDGLSSVVSDVEIKEILLAEIEPQAACESLVTLANQRGGPDNITVLAARMTDGGSGSNIAGGRVVGPAQRNVTRPLADTLKLRRSRRAIGRIRLARWFATMLILLFGALVSGLVALLAGILSLPTRLSLIALVVVAAFVLGALLGWLLRSLPSK